jgi:hypothetical protein
MNKLIPNETRVTINGIGDLYMEHEKREYITIPNKINNKKLVFVKVCKSGLFQIKDLETNKTINVPKRNVDILEGE